MACSTNSIPTPHHGPPHDAPRRPIEEEEVSTALAEHREISADEYHACPAWGASMLEDFRQSRRTSYARHVAKTEPKPEPTDAMKLGTLVHLRLLEPAEFSKTVRTMPAIATDGTPWNFRKPAHREARDSLAASLAADGLTVIEREQFEQVEAIAASVLGNWHARRLLERDGQPEYSIFWTDKETGIPLKCRVDWWSTLPLDIKTTCDPSPEAFSRQCAQLGYDRKRAHYLAGIAAHVGESLPLVHLAVGTQPYYPCCPYDLDDTDANGKSRGQRQWRQTLRDLAACLESGDWAEPYEKQIVSLRLPNWAHHSDEFSVL